jgi:hypothetical protein
VSLNGSQINKIFLISTFTRTYKTTVNFCPTNFNIICVVLNSPSTRPARGTLFIVYQLDEKKYMRKFGRKIPNRELISILAQDCVAGHISISRVAFVNDDDKNNNIIIIQ